MRCEELMTAEVEGATPDDTLRQAAVKMRDLNVGFLPVCSSDGTVLGVLTDRDIVVRAVSEELPSSTPVTEVMTNEIVSCRPDEDIRRAEQLMRVNQKNRILIIDNDGRLAGIISMSDLAQYEDARRVGELAGDISNREIGAH